jgi:hypothetical protein
MDMASLARWRDAALLLLVLQAAVLGLLPAVVFYRSIQGLQQLDERLRPVLFELRLRLWRVLSAIRRAADAIAAPFVWLHSVAAGLRGALHHLSWRHE